MSTKRIRAIAGDRPNRRVRAVVGVVVAALVVSLAVAPVALNSTTTNGLSAYVTVTNRGPIPDCSPVPAPGENCTSIASWAQFLIHVVNGNRPQNWQQFSTRETVPGAYVVKSVDLAIFVNGTPLPNGEFTLNPPPAAVFLSWAGHWASTVTCTGAPGSFSLPCNIVGSPAVIPGENTVVLYTSFWHDVSEPNGKYVVKYTVHGTVDGAPVDLTATTQPILMT